MTLSAISRRFAPLVAAFVLVSGLGGCAALGTLVHERTEGYSITKNDLAQIRPGQSQALVRLVLGSPQATNSFGAESAWYYVQTKVDETTFGLKTIKSRTVLAIYFDKDNRVKDRAIYGLKDGKAVAFESRHTPSYGEDKTFVQSLLSSI